MLTFLFLNQTLWCYHSWELSRRDDFNECHIIGFGWEMRKLSGKPFCSLFLNCSPAYAKQIGSWSRLDFGCFNRMLRMSNWTVLTFQMRSLWKRKLILKSLTRLLRLNPQRTAVIWVRSSCNYCLSMWLMIEDAIDVTSLPSYFISSLHAGYFFQIFVSFKNLKKIIVSSHFFCWYVIWMSNNLDLRWSPTFCGASSGSKLFAKVINGLQNSPLAG